MYIAAVTRRAENKEGIRMKAVGTCVPFIAVSIMTLLMIGCSPDSGWQPAEELSPVAEPAPSSAAETPQEADPAEPEAVAPVDAPAETEMPAEDPAPGVEEAAAEPEEPAKKLTFAEQVSVADNFASVHSLERDYAKRNTQSEAMDQAFAEKWVEVTKNLQPQTLHEGVDLLGVHTLATGDEEYTLHFLFRPSADIADDYHLSVQGHVLPANMNALPEADQKRGYVALRGILRDESATSNWKEGELRVVRVRHKGALVPLNVRLNLHTRDGNKFGANVGEQLTIGWQWAVADEKAFLKTIERCDDFATLYAIAPTGPELSPALSGALDKKWKAITAEATPQAISDDLEYISVSSNVSGKKEYTFSFLFRPKSDLDTDYHMTVVARVDESHKQHIKAVKPGGTYTNWPVLLYSDPTSSWKAGEYRVAQYRVDTEIIPFDLSISLHTRGGKKEFTGTVGTKLELGWQADVAE
jgi:hypothetical protein